MAIKISSTPVRITVSLSGEIDHHNAAMLRLEADSAIQSSLAPNVRLDFDDVTFMDSSGIGLVMGRYRNLVKLGAELHIINAPPPIYKMMKLAGIERLATMDKGVNM